MGQLFDRIGRVIRAELNSYKDDGAIKSFDAGAAFVAGGAVTGASIGKIGVLAGGTGYSVGVIPLAAFGALTGAALYEALRSILAGDSSSAGAAGIGAAAGASTSPAIGGMGVAASGNAIGVGMVGMAAGGAVVGLGIVGINRLLQQGLDPEKLLDQAIEGMEADARKARSALINVTACQKRLQQQYEQTQAEVGEWERRARLALEKGDEYLAREALSRNKMHTGLLNSIKTQIDQEPDSFKSLKQNLTLLEAKLAEAEIMRTLLKAQIATARASGQLQSIADRIGTTSAMSAFERMEETVLQMEARSEAAAELAGADLESQFAQLEAGSDVDDELAALKAMLLTGSSPRQAQLSGTQTTTPASSLAVPEDAAMDAELEDLKRQLDEL
jgi:phage shock protein A